jgi:hypothetical protein
MPDTCFAGLMSRGTQIADCVAIVFNTSPRFSGKVIALKSRILALKLRTIFSINFVRDLSATRQLKIVKS